MTHSILILQDDGGKQDIGYMWHAHMLSPFRYFEDLARNLQLGVFKSSLPLHLLVSDYGAPRLEKMNDTISL